MAKFNPAQYARAKGRTPTKGAAAGVGYTLVFTGGPELADALRELGDFAGKTTAKNAMKRGMIVAAQPMIQSARANAPKDTHGLEQSITASTRLSKRQKRARRGADKFTMEVFVGPDYRKGAHGVLQEFGTEDRWQRDRMGVPHKFVGRVTPHPFMRPAFDSTYRTVFDGFVPAIAAEIEKARQRVYRKQKRALAKAAKK